MGPKAEGCLSPVSPGPINNEERDCMFFGRGEGLPVVKHWSPVARHEEKMQATHYAYPSKYGLFTMRLRYILLCIVLLVSSQAIVVVAHKSYYDILGISKSSSPTDIKKAYRKLALKHHPDKGGDEERFKEISKAFECLSDPEQRDLYDTYGEAGLSGGGPNAGSFPFGGSSGGNPFGGGRNPFGSGGNSFGGFGSAGGGPFQSYFFNVPGQNGGGQNKNGNGNIDLSDLLQKMMGGTPSSGFQSSNFQSSSSSQPSKSYSKPVTCTLEDLAQGTTKKLKVTFQGKQKIYDIKLKPGWKEGTKITFPGKPGGHPTMIFVVKQVPHKFLRREGDDLHFTCWISETQTQGGLKVNIPLPSGEAWSKTIPRGDDEHVVSNGEKMVIPSKGMPIKGGPKCGDLIIEFRIRRSAEG